MGEKINETSFLSIQKIVKMEKSLKILNLNWLYWNKILRKGLISSFPSRNYHKKIENWDFSEVSFTIQRSHYILEHLFQLGAGPGREMQGGYLFEETHYSKEFAKTDQFFRGTKTHAHFGFLHMFEYKKQHARVPRTGLLDLHIWLKKEKKSKRNNSMGVGGILDIPEKYPITQVANAFFIYEYFDIPHK